LHNHADLVHPYTFPTRRSSDLVQRKEKAVGVSVRQLLDTAKRLGLSPGSLRFQIKSISAPTNASSIYKIGDREISLPMASSLRVDRKSTRLNSSHVAISYAVFC